MKFLESSHLLYVTVVAIALVISSCNSETDIPENTHNLPEAVTRDFRNRCGDTTIDDVYTGNDSYRHTDQQETFIFSSDKAGNEYVVVYLNNVWNRTIKTLPAIDQLPYKVLQRLLQENPEARKNEFCEIKEMSQTCINDKYYILCYLQDTPTEKNLVHTLVIGSDGTILKSCKYMLNLPVNARPLSTDIDWISKRYSGAVTLGYVNDLGSDNYLVIHNGVLKSVLFKFKTSNIDTKWEETTYALPKGATVPNNILESLHTTHAGFTYTEVMCVENPSGNYYLFIDGTKPNRLGYYVEAI